VLIGSRLSVRVPQGLLRNAIGLVLIASAITLITKEQVPPSILVPALAGALLVIGALFAFQISMHSRTRLRGRQATATAG
jgi:hypothetical protein